MTSPVLVMLLVLVGPTGLAAPAAGCLLIIAEAILRVLLRPAGLSELAASGLPVGGE